MSTIFFQSSMPRAGSTLLQNVLAQNPEIYATPTSGVLELVFSARQMYTESLEFKAQDTETMNKGFVTFCREGMHGWYDAVTDKPYVVDKSRGWGVHYDFLDAILGYKPKVLCMVRDLRQIISSMEKKFRENPLTQDPIVNHANMSGTSIAKRAEIWLNSQPVGLALERLSEIINRGWADHIHFIKFEDFVKSPKKEMDKIYDYLEIERYDHDFKKVDQVTKEDDTVYGTYGDHTINPVVTDLPRDYYDVLGIQASNYIRQFGEFYFDYFKYDPLKKGRK